MGLVQEFKDFAMRGNVIDMAVGVVIGGAFGKIVGSLVEKVIMPITGFLTQGVNVADMVYDIPLPQTAIDKGLKGATLGYGAFLQAVIDFIIVAFAIFLMVKLMNSMKKKEAAAPAAPPEDIVLLRQIRDALAKR